MIQISLIDFNNFILYKKETQYLHLKYASAFFAINGSTSGCWNAI